MSLAAKDAIRFARQVVLPEVGEEGQAALRSARVLVVGCGGLAAPVCTYLVAAGVGRIGIVDADQVDATNLPRQTLFTARDIGRPKVEAAAEQLKSLSEGVEIDVFPERFRIESAIKIASRYQALVDCTDNLASKYLLNDVALQLGLPLVFGSVTGFDGQFGVFDGDRGACYRCLYPGPPRSQVRNCQEAGVLGAAVGVVGSWQALECLKVILHRAGLPRAIPGYGKLVTIDLLRREQRELAIPKRAGCLCGKGREFELSLIQEQACSLQEFDVDGRVARELDESTGFLDVRESGEEVPPGFPGACRWPLSRIESGDFPPFLREKKSWLLYCSGGIRSRKALSRLSPAFPGVRFLNLAGGLAAVES